MSERNKKIAITICVFVILMGSGFFAFGATYDADKNLNYVDKYDQSHAEEKMGTLSKIVNDDKNTDVEELYVTKTKEDMSNETYNKTVEIIENEDKDSEILYSSNSQIAGEFAYKHQGEYHILSISSNIPNPMLFVLTGLVLFAFGAYYLNKLLFNNIEYPDSIEESESNDWDYKIDK